MHALNLGILTLAIIILVLSILILNKVNSKCKNSENFMAENPGPPWSVTVTKVTSDTAYLDDGSSFSYTPFCHLKNIKVGDIFQIIQNGPEMCIVLWSPTDSGLSLTLGNVCPSGTSPLVPFNVPSGNFPPAQWLQNNPNSFLYYTYVPMFGQPNIPICSCY